MRTRIYDRRRWPPQDESCYCLCAIRSHDNSYFTSGLELNCKEIWFRFDCSLMFIDKPILDLPGENTSINWFYRPHQWNIHTQVNNCDIPGVYIYIYIYYLHLENHNIRAYVTRQVNKLICTSVSFQHFMHLSYVLDCALMYICHDVCILMLYTQHLHLIILWWIPIMMYACRTE